MEKKREIKSEDYYKRMNNEQLYALRLRCLVSGCQYGIEMLDKKPKERCIWCGEKNPIGHFEGIKLPELLSNIKEE